MRGRRRWQRFTEGGWGREVDAARRVRGRLLGRPGVCGGVGVGGMDTGLVKESSVSIPFHLTG